MTLELDESQYEDLKNLLVWAELYFLAENLHRNDRVFDNIDAAVHYRPGPEIPP